MQTEKLNWQVNAVVRKYDRDTLESMQLLDASIEQIEAAMEPTDTLHAAGNSLLNEGITRMLQLLIGGGGTPYSNANAELGVGDSSAVVSPTQTNLQGGANIVWGAMDTGYPTITAQTVSFKATFNDADANFAWNEWGIRNGATANENLNRKVVNLGTKAGGVWSLQVNIVVQ